MSDVRLVALDVDGTLLTSDGTLTLRVKNAVRAACMGGATVAIATARRWTGARFIAQELELEGPLIVFDGALVRAFPGGEPLLAHTLSPLLTQQIAQILAAHELQVVTQHSLPEGERMAVSASPAHPDWMQAYLSATAGQTTVVPLSEVSSRFSDTIRVVTFGPEPRLRAAFDSLGALPIGRQILPHGNYGTSELTLFAPEASKGAALRWLAERLAIPLAQTMAVGDGVNDVSMLRIAGLGVAMGNAAPEVKLVANATTATNDDDGVALAIERYVLGAGAGFAVDEDEADEAAANEETA